MPSALPTTQSPRAQPAEIEEPSLEPGADPWGFVLKVALGLSLLMTVAWVVALVALARWILSGVF